MSSKIKKLNRKLDKMADNAKDGAGQVAGKIIDAGCPDAIRPPEQVIEAYLGRDDEEAA